MKLIRPQVELWPEPDAWQEQVARAARLCYASEGGQKSAVDFCEMLINRKHKSMFRHGSAYFVFTIVGEPDQSEIPNWLVTALNNSPYAGVRYHKDKKKKERTFFVSTNRHYLMDHDAIAKALHPYEVTLQEFMNLAREKKFHTAFALIRYTVCVTTQISTSRELNRTSPNNIAEQSTRYVNFGKKGGITICLPHWYECAHWTKKIMARVFWKFSEWAYTLGLRLGLPAQDARGFLVLDTATRVCYTYNVFEWRNIMRLRLTGETGKPHPNAKIAAQLIHDAILPKMREYGGENSNLV